MSTENTVSYDKWLEGRDLLVRIVKNIYNNSENLNNIEDVEITTDNNRSYEFKDNSLGLDELKEKLYGKDAEKYKLSDFLIDQNKGDSQNSDTNNSEEDNTIKLINFFDINKMLTISWKSAGTEEENDNAVYLVYEEEAKAKIYKTALYGYLCHLTTKVKGEENKQWSDSVEREIIKHIEILGKVRYKKTVEMINDIKKRRDDYKEHEIHNLLICLTHGFINVLSGPPGCGKTSICNIMAASMGLSAENNTYVPISVGRNWNDTGDLLGYYNPFSDSMNGTPLYTALTENNESNKAPLMVLLDESNLSSMEYYWSDFMGMCDDKKGSISIKSSDTKVEIHENVRFIATINNDETTERLSPRLIDRSWIITLPDNTSGEEIWSMGSLESDIIELSESVVTMEGLKEFYQPWGKTDSVQETDYTEAIKGCFEYPNDTQDNEDGGEQTAVQISVTDILKDLGIELSARSRQAIIQYVAAAMSIVDGEDMRIMNKKLIMDYVFMQKVLPKINGYGDGYRAGIEKLKEVLNDYFKEVELSKNEVETSYRTVDYLDKVLKKGETTKYYTFFM